MKNGTFKTIIWRITWGLGYFEDYNCYESCIQRGIGFMTTPPSWARLPIDKPRVIQLVNDEVVNYDFKHNKF